MIPKHWKDTHEFQYDEIVPGRVSRLLGSPKPGNAFNFVLWNVHNFGLAAAEMGRVADRLRADVSECHEHPFSRFTMQW